jgi:NAD/NADP transhydrogenase beta subunit
MSSSISNLFVDLFFVQATLGLAIVSWWFLSKKKATLKNFGWGLLGYTLGMAAWTCVVLIKPTNLKPLILVGVVPFLLGNLMFAKVATTKVPSKTNWSNLSGANFLLSI